MFRERENRGIANLYNKQTLAAFTLRNGQVVGPSSRAAEKPINTARARHAMSAGHASFFSDDFRMPREIPNDDRDR